MTLDAAHKRGSHIKKKHSVLLLTIALLVIVPLVCVYQVSADEQVYPSDFEDDEGNYPALQEVIDAAGEGDIITLEDGTYVGSLVISTPITLQGQHSDVSACIIQGDGGNTITITSNGATVRYLTITDGGEDCAGVFLSEVESCVVCNNAITENLGIGVRSDQGSYNEIVDNDIYLNGQAGIRVDGLASYVLVSDNEVYENVAQGIFVYSASQVTITGNIIRSNDVELLTCCGISIEDSSDVTVENNQICSNGVCGINLYKATTCFIKTNTITDNDGAGISIGSECEAIEVTDNNYISRNAAQGIHLFDAESILISGNTIGADPVEVEGTGNAFEGVYAMSCSFVTLTDNVILYNGLEDDHGDVYSGVLLDSSSIETTVTGNSICYSGANGIHIASSSDVHVGESDGTNTIEENGYSGIFVEGGSWNSIKYNTIDENGDFGVLIDAADIILVEANGLQGNSEAGLQVVASENIDVVGNTVSGNLVGIVFISVFDSKITDSEESPSIISSNFQDGINVYQSSEITVMDNDVNSNGWTGIYLSESSSNLIETNTLTENDAGICLDRGSSQNRVIANTITNPISNGIILRTDGEYYTEYNTIDQNVITGAEDSGDGIHLIASTGNWITNNIIDRCQEGIRLISQSDLNVVAANTITSSKGDGIGLEGSSNYNDLLVNHIEGSAQYGIHPDGGSEDTIVGTDIIGNTFDQNGVGVMLSNTEDTSIIQNKFFSNLDAQAGIEGECAGAVWDAGLSGGGNYWSTLIEAVDENGDSITVDEDQDGINDEPYDYNGLLIDEHPFLNPWESKYQALTAYGETWPVVLTASNQLTEIESLTGAVQFKISGEDEIGYIRAVAPMGSSEANPQIQIDGDILTTNYEISDDSENYFIYCSTPLTEHTVPLLFAVPEYAWGGLAALAVCFVAFVLFKKCRNSPPNFTSRR